MASYQRARGSPDDQLKIVVYLHTFGFSRGSINSIRHDEKNFPIHPNYLIDTRLLPAVHKDTVWAGVSLSGLDGRYEAVQRFLNQRGQLTRLVEGEAEIIVAKLDEWVQRGWRKVNIAIGSNWGRHRAVAVQELLAKELRQLMQEKYDLEITVKMTYFAFLPEPFIQLQDRERVLCRGCDG